MINGTVKTVIRDRGFGFIVADDGKEFFYHRADAPDFDGVFEDDRVTFELVEPQPVKGPRARDIRRAAC